MTGRGRPRKAKSPDTKCLEGKTEQKIIKQKSLEKDSLEKKQNGIAKERKPKEQKTANHAAEKIPGQRGREKTKKQLTEEDNKEQKTPTDNTKAAAPGTKAKMCTGKAKSPNKFTDETTKTTKAKPRGGGVKSPRQFVDTAEAEPLKDNTNDSVLITKPKTRTVGVKSPEQVVNETKMPLEALMKMTKDKEKTLAEITVRAKMPTVRPKAKTSVQQDRCEAAVDSILSTTLKKLKIKKVERSDAAKVINEIITNIIMHLKRNTQCFKEVEEPLRSGSYYENLKISNPDEFDVMLPMPVDRVNIEPFGDDGAFYSVGLKRGNNPLKKFEEKSILSASKMLQEFREEVMKCVKQFPGWQVTRKKPGCPAVTLETKVQTFTISLDVVLCIVVKSSWPSFTTDGLKIEGWLGAKVKQELKRKPYYLVPKYEGKGNVERDGICAKDSWRVSFSHVEKAILKNHGSEKTCCEREGGRCCRKDCLKLLKYLLRLLKEKNSFDKFCSYHGKTTLLHACCSRTRDSDWSASSLRQCFQLVLQDFIQYLEKGELPNFFIPTQNLLSGVPKKKCSDLARCIREELDNGFPIFRQQLQN